MVLPKVLAQTVPLQGAAIDIFRNKHEARRWGTVAALQKAGVPGCTQVAGVCEGGGVDCGSDCGFTVGFCLSWPWTHCLLSLCLSFLVCKVETKTSV